MSHRSAPQSWSALLLAAVVLLSWGCVPAECPADTNCGVNPDDDDSAQGVDDDDGGGDDDDAGDDDTAADDDDSTDPENPFGGSLHEGDYSGLWDLTYIAADSGVIFCSGSTDLNITANGTLSGQGTCVLMLNGQPMEPEATISFTALAEMTDVGNMNSAQLSHTLSYAPAEELQFLLDGSASQGMIDLQWSGMLPLPDGERSFAGHASAELTSR